MGSKRVLLFVAKTIEDNRLPWLRQGSFLKKYNKVQRVALATTIQYVTKGNHGYDRVPFFHNAIFRGQRGLWYKIPFDVGTS